MVKTARKGVLSRLQSMLQRNRLGELLVISGLISSQQLHYALVRQKAVRQPLGRVLVAERMVSRNQLYGVLIQQHSIRMLAGIVTVLVAMSVTTKAARAGSIRDVASEMSLVSQANSAFAPIHSYPALFGTAERRSDRLDAFVKWTGMFDRFERALHNPANRGTINAWEDGIRPYAGMPLEQMAAGVNSFVNQEQYITDQDNWHVADYWETPVEFFQRGGDCEDFAIAKYASLRALGVPEERMRLAIVQDEEKNEPHAVLILYGDRGAMVLDNQAKDVRYSESVNRYRPIFSINRYSWWLHTAPGNTMVASVN